MVDAVLGLSGAAILGWLTLAGVTLLKRRHKIGLVVLFLILCAQAIRGVILQNANTSLQEAHAQETKQAAETHRRELAAITDELKKVNLQLEGLRQLRSAPARPPAPAAPHPPELPAKEGTAVESHVPVDRSSPVLAQQQANVRITTRPGVSTIKGAPYALEVVLQTDVTIPNPAFAIKTDGEIFDGTVTAGGGPMIIMMNLRWSISSDRKAFFFSYGYPALSPEAPATIRLYSVSPIKVIGFERL